VWQGVRYEKERPPQNVQVFVDERFQCSDMQQCSRAARVADNLQIPEDFYTMMASQMVQLRGDAPTPNLQRGVAVAQAPQAFAMGTPARGDAAREGVWVKTCEKE
jgi:hypothetical protein